ncbi:MAG: DUF5672 family protein [Candidatus Pacebacteria bacterium]|nr:DUF5672 family protein [Candidatus Paceibacterota bacterium]
MKDLPHVTLVAVSSIRIPETITALKKSMVGIRFSEALLLTHEKISLEKEGIKVITIEKLDYKGYSDFMLYKLKDYIHTDFALVVQYDGYVIRPKEWRDEFLSYDYIGAPWPKNLHFTKEGVNVRVGNGGFSLRSKKLLEVPAKLNLPFTDNGTGYFNEDGNLCVYYRKVLEENGVKFAPVSVASIFSREKVCDDSYPRPFGFHAKKQGLAGIIQSAEKKITSIKKYSNKVHGKLRYESRGIKRFLKRELSSIKNQLAPNKTSSAYREKIKVYDIFTFFNELDLLEIRLNILDPHVDYFVIVEAPKTFSGMPKPLYFAENKERFAQWKDKIIHYVVADAAATTDELKAKFDAKKYTDEIDKKITEDVFAHSVTGENGVDWTKELYQKESIKKALVGLNDDDICYVSDVDEIWNPDAKVDYTQNRIYRLKQYMYAYYLNNRSSESWIGPLVAKYKIIKDSYLNDLRSEKKTSYTYVKNGGWHFTNMGGADQIRKKIESYGHQEFNNTEIKSKIEQMMSDNKDFVGRKFAFWKDESDLPLFILKNKEAYKKYFN